jgi:hypothetical protein
VAPIGFGKVEPGRDLGPVSGAVLRRDQSCVCSLLVRVVFGLAAVYLMIAKPDAGESLLD